MSEPQRSQLSNEEIAKMISNAVADALKVAIPAAAIGINQANQDASNKSREAIVREAQKKTQRCPICLLPQSACGGPWAKDKDGKDIIMAAKDGSPDYRPEVNHIRYYCGPHEENLFKWFQGVIVNGVRFLADYRGHLQWIPKKSDIPTIISNWERNEKELSQKREAQGHQMQSNGSIAPTPNMLGWR